MRTRAPPVPPGNVHNRERPYQTLCNLRSMFVHKSKKNESHVEVCMHMAHWHSFVHYGSPLNCEYRAVKLANGESYTHQPPQPPTLEIWRWKQFFESGRFYHCYLGKLAVIYGIRVVRFVSLCVCARVLVLLAGYHLSLIYTS